MDRPSSGTRRGRSASESLSFAPRKTAASSSSTQAGASVNGSPASSDVYSMMQGPRDGLLCLPRPSTGSAVGPAVSREKSDMVPSFLFVTGTAATSAAPSDVPVLEQGVQMFLRASLELQVRAAAPPRREPPSGSELTEGFEDEPV